MVIIHSFIHSLVLIVQCRKIWSYIKGTCITNLIGKSNHNCVSKTKSHAVHMLSLGREVMSMCAYKDMS